MKRTRWFFSLADVVRLLVLAAVAGSVTTRAGAATSETKRKADEVRAAAAKLKSLRLEMAENNLAPYVAGPWHAGLESFPA